MTYQERIEYTVEGLRQFWLRQISIVFLSVVLYAVTLWLAWPEVSSLPRDVIETLFTASATLLGLTFTAFAILATFIPGLRADFVRSRTFVTMGKTFTFSMGAEFCTLVLSGISMLAYGTAGSSLAGLTAVFFAILSAGLLVQLIGYMSTLFRMARSRR